MCSLGSCDDVVWFCLCRWENWEAREHSRCRTAPRSDFSSVISENFCPFALSCGILCLKWSPEELLENPRVPRKTIDNPRICFLPWLCTCLLSLSIMSWHHVTQEGKSTCLRDVWCYHCPTMQCSLPVPGRGASCSRVLGISPRWAFVGLLTQWVDFFIRSISGPRK